jgi:hypothetical protein
VSFLRVWPWKFAPSPSVPPSFRWKLFWLAHASIQGAVDGEVFVRHQALRLVDHVPEEGASQLVIQEAIAVLGEHRRGPDGFVHIHADEPAEQDVVVELLHQQPLTPDRIEDLQQLRPQQALWRHRGSADLRIQPVEVRRHRPQDTIHERPDGAQRMVTRHTLLGRHVAEHRVGLTIISTHDADRSTGSTRRRSLEPSFSASS